PVDVDDLLAGFAESIEIGGYYERLAAVGLNYGPTFRGLERLLRRDGAGLGLVSLPAAVSDRTRFHLHPALLDACFHVLGAAVSSGDSDLSDGMFVPVSIHGLQLHRSGATAVWCVGTLLGEVDASSASIAARLDLYDLDGTPVATIERLEARRVSPAMWQRSLGATRRPLYELQWHTCPRAEASETPRSWMVVGDMLGAGAALTARLAGSGATCVVVPHDAGPDTVAEALGALQAASATPVGVVDLRAIATAGSPDGVQRVVEGALHLARLLVDSPGADCRLWLVTQGGQSVEGEPPSVEQAVLWGLGRVIANELPSLACTCLDLDPAMDPDTVDQFVKELLATDSEAQVALRGTRRAVARLVRSSVEAEQTLAKPYRLVLGQRGSLDALSFEAGEPAAPGAGEVEIEVRATGINFRDVLNVLGMYPGNPGNPGLECAGVVVAVGDGVVDLAVGDEVFGIAPEAYDSHVVTPVHLMVRKPESITFAQAATLPVAFLTAVYGLSHLAGLRAGERVLIHAGAGGVGMAAIHLAKRLGAEVHATVGSAEKRRVMESMGVEHIYSSRTLDFAEQIMAATNGEGVDVVLNSLADEFIDRSFEVLAPTGRFLEIGKRGIWTDEQAAAARPNGRYHPYQLAEFLLDDPQGVHAALRSIADDITAGSAVPLPLRAFPVHSIEDAFRFMAQAKHIGKVVLTHRPSGPAIRDDGAYLVSGGLGGLGLIVADWLAEQGARHLTLTGRSAPSAEADDVVARLRAAGVRVQVVLANVSQPADVERLIAETTADAPLRGVFHAAGVLDDGALGQQTWERFRRVLAPKLSGAVLLDDATRTLDLDHFVLFSSVAALFGSPGQANYAAANAALDALAWRRRSHGLPALSVNWGAWASAGMAARMDAREQKRLADRGVGLLDSTEALDSLQYLLGCTRPQVAVMSMDWTKVLAAAGPSGAPALLSELVSSDAHTSGGDSIDGGESGLLAALEGAAPSHRRIVAVDHVTMQLVRVLGLSSNHSIDGDQDLAELGLDSLMAVELTNRLRSASGLALPASLAFDHPSVHRLADHLLDLLGDADAAAELAHLPSAASAVAVVPVDRGGPMPASSAQARLLFVDRMVPGLAIYNIPVVMRLRGALDLDAMRASVDALVARHEALRTNFVLAGEQYLQEIVPDGQAVVPFVVHSEPLDGGELDAALHEEVTRPFNLRSDVKLRVAVYRTGAAEHVMSVTVHHIATDGWSIVRLVAELAHLYSAAVQGTTPQLAELPVQYADWSAWQRGIEEASSHSGERTAYWLDTLSGSLPVLDLPADHRRPALQSFRGGRHRLDLDVEFYARVHDAARDAGVTPFVFLLAAYVATLARWSGQDDLIVGTASANRQRPETYDVVGMFVNMLAIRTPVDLGQPFDELLEVVKVAARGAFDHEDVPFDRIVEAINPPRDLSRSIVFQATFILHNMPVPKGSMAGLDVDVLDVSVGATEYDLACSITEVEGAAQVNVEFNADVFDGVTVERLMGHWRVLLESALVDSSVAVGGLSMMPAGERALIAGWASGGELAVGGPQRLEQLVAVAAGGRGSGVAVRSGEEVVSFADLLDRSHRLAHALVAAGVRPGERVGVAVDRSVAMVVSLLAVLEVGAAYVPLDPGFPSDRLAFMVADAGVGVVLVSAGSLDGRLDTSSMKVIDVVEEADAIGSLPAEPVSVDVSGLAGGGVAYVIYTSGSTGMPKGVEIEHASVVNFVRSMIAEPGIGADDVLLAVTTLSFDISVLEIFCPLVAGATVVVASDADIVDGRRLARLIEETGASVMQATPTTWSMLFDTGWAGRSQLTVLCGGEAMPVELGRRLVECCGPVWNMFGPTETTVWSTVQRVDASVLQHANVPIGRPIANTVCRVLASNGELAPIGVPGELFIGGAGVARGYLNRDELTAERFVPDRFSADDGARLYRTGDLARWLPDGSIEFLGRSDFQVKVRGHRIELGEIESALRGHPGVVDVVVVADGQAAAGRLLAYPIYSDPESPPSVADLRVWLQSRVPDYMIPSRFIGVEAFPLTANRKIDRNALPRPDAAASSGAEFVAPRDPVEQTLASIIASTLEAERVGVNDDFFELGGHSLHATSVLAKIEDTFGIAIDLRSFFLTPTVAHLAATLTSDPTRGDRVRKVAEVRVRLASMTPEQVARELAARRSAVENGRS
ncbi:MAG: amino acid adenylation domain-containing protein, partial [Acidimicrobiales bacterium]|nr:amino acid adenylation domain-containing protein [Acidimicrobiales bacterium]